MARRHYSGANVKAEPDLTPMIDVSFQLLTFFVMLMAISKDEIAQKINLPYAQSAPILEDDKIPDSLHLNVAFLGYPNEQRDPPRPLLKNWGITLDLTKESGWEKVTKLIRNEASLQRRRQAQRGEKDTRKLTTTIIMRLDSRVEYGVFRRLMDISRQSGFVKYQVKAAESDNKR